MKKLTKAEEEIMQLFWQIGRATVSQIIESMPSGKKPPHSSVSSIARILEKKGFLGFKAYGRTYEYYPMVSKEEYSRRSLKKLVLDYFDGSYKHLVSFLVRDENIDPDELNRIIEQIDHEEQER